jgi:hypothetical protein
MMALVDNDVLLKGACYRLLNHPINTGCGVNGIGYLGAARFVLSKRIRRARLRGNAAEAEAELVSFLGKHQAIEPTTEERTLAAALEVMAQGIPVNLDTGESQLLAVLAVRTLPALITGDKRAIIAIERLLDATTALAQVTGKVTCLEQLVRRAVMNSDKSSIQEAICKEPEVDRALSICFSCFSSERTVEAVVQALDSYISALRQKAPRTLST